MNQVVHVNVHIVVDTAAPRESSDAIHIDVKIVCAGQPVQGARRRECDHVLGQSESPRMRQWAPMMEAVVLAQDGSASLGLLVDMFPVPNGTWGFSGRRHPFNRA